MPRWWNTESTRDAEDISLHIFCDAASTGFGAVAYRRVVGRNGEVFCTIVTSRAHVVPLNSAKASHHNSIPRLELTAAEKGTQLRQFIETSVGTFKEVVFWTDSECVLKMINDTSTRFKLFYANKLSKIAAASEEKEWMHVDSARNTADYCSRGLQAHEEEKWRLFHRGPEFLWKQRDDWPAQNTLTQAPRVELMAVSARRRGEIQPLLYIYNLAKTASTWHKTLRRVAAFYKIIENWRINARRRREWREARRTRRSVFVRTPLSLQNLDWHMAEEKVLKAVQAFYFADEMSNIAQNTLSSRAWKRERKNKAQLKGISSKL